MSQRISTISPGLAKAYSSSSTYEKGEWVLHQNAYWQCKTAIQDPEEWTEDHWELKEEAINELQRFKRDYLDRSWGEKLFGFKAEDDNIILELLFGEYYKRIYDSDGSGKFTQYQLFFVEEGDELANFWVYRVRHHINETDYDWEKVLESEGDKSPDDVVVVVTGTDGDKTFIKGEHSVDTLALTSEIPSEIPLAKHAETHAIGGQDPLLPDAIGAVPVTRSINGKQLTADIKISADDTEYKTVGAETITVKTALDDHDARMDSLELSLGLKADEADLIDEGNRAKDAEGELRTRITVIEDNYLTEDQIDAKILVETTRAEGAENALDSRMTAAETSITTLNGDATVEGSVAHAVKVETDRAEGVEDGLDARITVIEDNYLTEDQIDARILVETTRAENAESALGDRIDRAIPWANSGHNAAVIGGQVGVPSIGDYSFAAGYNIYASGRASIAAGGFAVTEDASYTRHDRALVWQGKNVNSFYRSHGSGTFNINPQPEADSTDPKTGVWIGEEKLSDILEDVREEAVEEAVQEAVEESVQIHEYNTSQDFPAAGEAGHIYIAKDTNYQYRYDEISHDYIQIGGGGGGTGTDEDAVHYYADEEKTDEQKAIARANIGAASQEDVDGLVTMSYEGDGVWKLTTLLYDTTTEDVRF